MQASVGGKIAQVGQRLIDGVAKSMAEDFFKRCLLYTSDAADERSSVDLGGRRIIKKKKRERVRVSVHSKSTI